jgi:mono/diheme cytochrome c family protein
MEEDEVQTPEPGRRSDQQIFDDQVARAMGRAVLIFGGLAITAALVMSTIALVNSSGDNGTTTVTVTAKQPAPRVPVLSGDALGKQLFVSGDPGAGVIACGSCHILSDAGSTSTVGPNLDKELGADPASAARESIVDPNKEIIKGYAADVMPKNYGAALNKTQLDALVNYVFHNTNTKYMAAHN